MSFRNRMAEHGAVKVQDVKPHPRNWRLHPEAQRKLLVEVLGDVGWVDGLLINRTTGLLLDGHARLEEAKKAGLTEVPATFVELTEAEETMVLALLDPLSSFAYADTDLLQQVAAAAGPIAPIDLYISGKVEEQPEEGSITLADAHTVTVHVGDIAFSIPHTAYVQWRDSLIQQVGMKRRKLIGAVAERLGLAPASP